MLLTITNTCEPATDLGYLLHKNPDRPQAFDLPFGTAHVYYPEASPTRCTAALLVDVDPILLSRSRKDGSGGSPLRPYVNAVPYVASSFMSVAISRVFRSAMAGKCESHPHTADAPLPLEAHIPAVLCRGGEPLLRHLFEPLGYRLDVESHPLDTTFAEWGDAPVFSITLIGLVRLRELLTHLYVLIPVLDGEKHYFVGDAEVEKLLRHGEGWLSAHPERELIARRYLKNQRSLARQALAQLLIDEELDAGGDDDSASVRDPEDRLGLNEQRIADVVAELTNRGATSILDLGCGEGKLLQALLDGRQFTRILGMDVSMRSLEKAAARLRLHQMPPLQRQRLDLIQGSLLYKDSRLEHFDAATVIEVMEHLDAARLAAFERVLFEFAGPGTVVLTTPNIEYNSAFGLSAGDMRHSDHRFEWTREQFQDWAGGVASRHGYGVEFRGIGPVDAEHGTPTQMAVFTR